jgi:hypothetical protein
LLGKNVAAIAFVPGLARAWKWRPRWARSANDGRSRLRTGESDGGTSVMHITSARRVLW